MTTRPEWMTDELLERWEEEAEAAADAAETDPRLRRRGAELAARARALVAPPSTANPTFAAGTDPSRDHNRAVRGARMHVIRHLETLRSRLGVDLVPSRQELVAMPDDQLRAIVERVENLARNAVKSTR